MAESPSTAIRVRAQAGNLPGNTIILRNTHDEIRLRSARRHMFAQPGAPKKAREVRLSWQSSPPQRLRRHRSNEIIGV
jgi:hypothetical protein